MHGKRGSEMHEWYKFDDIVNGGQTDEETSPAGVSDSSSSRIIPTASQTERSAHLLWVFRESWIQDGSWGDVVDGEDVRAKDERNSKLVWSEQTRC